jgi:hypothetical protein
VVVKGVGDEGLVNVGYDLSSILWGGAGGVYVDNFRQIMRVEPRMVSFGQGGWWLVVLALWMRRWVW